MVGVPRSRGCNLCVKRRVKVGPLMISTPSHFRDTNTRHSATNVFQAVSSAKHMASRAPGMTRASNSLLESRIAPGAVPRGQTVQKMRVEVSHH